MCRTLPSAKLRKHCFEEEFARKAKALREAKEEFRIYENDSDHEVSAAPKIANKHQPKTPTKEDQDEASEINEGGDEQFGFQSKARDNTKRDKILSG